jgi:hypothetical protein
MSAIFIADVVKSSKSVTLGEWGQFFFEEAFLIFHRYRIYFNNTLS